MKSQLYQILKSFLPESIKKVLLPLIYSDPDRTAYQKMVKRWPVLTQYADYTIQYMIMLAEKRGFSSLEDYVRRLETDEEERNWLEVRFTFTGSHFFRGDDWTFFRENCLSRFRNAEHIRIWCAGCSSGQEVYSLILCLLDYVPADALDILATDYNDELLAKTSAGSYFMMHYHEIPEHYKKYTSNDGKTFVFHDDLRNRITAEHLDLLQDPYPSGFDIILCRNVIKFFSEEAKVKVQQSLADSLNSGGYLFLSHDDGNDDEMIKRPGRMSLEQIGSRSIYRRI